MFGLEFLKDLQVQEVAKAAPRKTSSINRQPAADFVGIRIWKSGAVYPSKALIDAFQLEYPTKVKITGTSQKAVTLEDGTVATQDVPTESWVVPQGVQANGLDVFTMASWSQIDEVTRSSHKLILVGVAPKSAPKVSLFNSVKYNEDGTALISVAEQGTVTFGKEVLLPMIEATYGAKPNEEGFIDLQVVTEFNLSSKVPNGIFHLPKVVTRGEDAGKADVVRRENISVFPLVVSQTAPAPAEQVVESHDAEVPQVPGPDFVPGSDFAGDLVGPVMAGPLKAVVPSENFSEYQAPGSDSDLAPAPSMSLPDNA
jgi:hypothetical protein